MKNKTLHGFEFTSSRPIPELSGTLHEAIYTKNGARLIFIEREDSNKTFAIAFKTIPEDDTGVFHILEHSVLCGSDKYPVKEPFVELLKGSLKTFLNAFTFPDKTMYPVSSRNEKDFLNLVDVYMDAVLHPTALKKPEIFYQEGWHHELHSHEDEMLYKGVVFNEMKGAYSSADEVQMSEMSALLYGESTYGRDSGGNPLYIPTLTYEDFVNAHRRYYHPSNARIILDGSVDLDKTLALLDSFLSEYDYLEIDTDIPFVAPMGHAEKSISYEISENDSPDGKARVCMGFTTFDFSERKKLIALSVAIDAIAASNEAPFKKAMLELGLCEDVSFISYDGVQQNSILIDVKNVKEENMRLAEAKAIEVLRGIVEHGIDKNALTASFNSYEFRLREQDSAGFPAGISYAISALDTWLYGGDPIKGLCFEEDIADLRKMLDTDFYEKLLRDVFLNSSHSATLYMTPSPSLGEERVRIEKEKLALAKSKMSEKELDALIEKTKALESWQAAPDSDEALSTLPSLELSDISKFPEKFDKEEYLIEGRPALHINAATRGIVYTKLLFDLSDLSAEELSLASFMTELHKNLPTEQSDTITLQTKIKSLLGAFSTSVLVTSKKERVTPYMLLSISSLESKLESAKEMAREVLLGTLFEDTAAIGRILRQLTVLCKEEMAASGHALALARSASYVSREAAVAEHVDGLEGYLYLKELDKKFASESKEVLEKLKALAGKIFTRSRITVCHAGKRCDDYARELVRIFPTSDFVSSECKIQPLGERREGIVIPAQIAFAAQTGNLFELSGCMHGSMNVVRSLLSYGFLWNAIRVQGGAYGAGFVRRANGTAGFYTYRDPDPSRSLDCFGEAAAYLREVAASGERITSFIIGAVGDSDPLITPKVAAAIALTSYLRDESYEERVELRRQMLDTSSADLVRAADIVEKISKGGVTVVGGRDKLLSCGEKIEKFIEI